MFEQEEETSFGGSRCGRCDRFRAEFTERWRRVWRDCKRSVRGCHNPSCQVPWTFSAPSVAAEMEQLQTRIAQLQAQNEELLSFKRAVEGARRAVEGRFCANARRRSCPVDARPSSRHARRNFSRERARVGTVVSNCGQCSEPIVQEFSPVHGRERDQLRCTIQSVVSEGSCVMRISKYGLRGCRVGDASIPGTRVKRRRRAESISQQSEESDFSDLLDLEEDLNMGPTDADPLSPHHRELFVRCIEVDLPESPCRVDRDRPSGGGTTTIGGTTQTSFGVGIPGIGHLHRPTCAWRKRH